MAKEVRHIRGKDLIRDVRLGKTNAELMDKYGLSSKGLREVFERLIHSNLVRFGELQDRLPPITDSVEMALERKVPRFYPIVRFPVYDVDNLSIEGHIHDITEYGLRAVGLPVRVGERKSLLIRGDEMDDIFPFCFDAECRWATGNGHEEPQAGFEIVNISEGGLTELRKLLERCTIGSLNLETEQIP